MYLSFVLFLVRTTAYYYQPTTPTLLFNKLTSRDVNLEEFVKQGSDLVFYVIQIYRRNLFRLSPYSGICNPRLQTSSIIHDYLVLFLHPLISFGFDIWNINSKEHVVTLEPQQQYYSYYLTQY